MNYSKSLALTFLLALTASNVFSYDVTDRYKLLDDKLKTEQMLRPLGHDFFLDIGAALNKNVKTVISDFSDASKFAGTSLQKLDNAQTVLSKYDKTEQTLKINLSLGIPIFSFSAWDLKVQPNFRVFTDVGANMGIRSEAITPALLLSFITIDIPASLKTKILATTYVGGDDLLAPASNPNLCDTLGDASAIAICKAGKGQFFYPTNTNIPNLFLFAKVDARAGLYNDYTYGEHFFGNFNFYALNRTDVYQVVTADAVANGTKIDLPKKKNTETSLQVDYRLGYKNDNYRIFTSVEDLKLSKFKERADGSKELTYGYKPLLRLHAEATYKFTVLTLNPFLGFHKRSGYGFADGTYAGADLGAYVWGDRLGLQMRGMLDKQYITLSPRMKLWLMQLEYSLKTPLKSTDGDVKLSAINSIDLRFFF
jgi:hypothetical protein